MSYRGPDSRNYETGVNININRFLNEFRVQNIHIYLANRYQNQFKTIATTGNFPRRPDVSFFGRTPNQR